MSTSNQENQTWKSKGTFLLAAAGSAIGLGNLWRFPYITGENGGGAFILVYLLCVLMLGLPLLMAEVSLGRYSRRSPITAMGSLARHIGASRGWAGVGIMGVLTGVMILSFYSVIAGWAMSYTYESFAGTFTGMPADEIGKFFSNMIADPVTLTIWHTVFMLASGIIVGRGIHKGLESGLKIMMPALFILMLLMLLYAITQTGQFGRAVEFMFKPDFSELSVNSIIAAMGQAFFTLSLGMCTMMTYGAYMPKENSIPVTCLSVAGLDTLIAIIAGLSIFPIVFAFGMEASAGPGLLFISMTTAFSQMSFGAIVGGLFFLLVTIAALSSAISLMEPAVAWLQERFGMSRAGATIIVGALIWFVGLGCVLSFNLWSGEEYKLFGKTFFDILDYLTANLMLPLGGMLVAIFAGWKMGRNKMMKELGLSTTLFNLWMPLTRIFAPAAVLVILFTSL
ncbi:sodium-dependent transporter [Endozoicomonadaceae bacterium StTr2]